MIRLDGGLGNDDRRFGMSGCLVPCEPGLGVAGPETRMGIGLEYRFRVEAGIRPAS